MTSTERGTPARYSLITGAIGETTNGTGEPAGDYVRSADYDALALDLRRAQEERDAKEADLQLIALQLNPFHVGPVFAPGIREAIGRQASELRAELQAARQEAEQRGRDAERLDWLFAELDDNVIMRKVQAIADKHTLGAVQSPPIRLGDFRAAIDAARANLGPAREVQSPPAPPEGK